MASRTSYARFGQAKDMYLVPRPPGGKALRSFDAAVFPVFMETFSTADCRRSGEPDAGVLTAVCISIEPVRWLQGPNASSDARTLLVYL